MRNKKIAALIATIGVIMIALTSYALAVQLTLDSNNVERIGGTGQVNVLSPEYNDVINSVTFTVDTDTSSTTFGRVIGVDVTWEPAEGGSYNIMVILYDNSNNVLGRGMASESVPDTSAGSAITTSISLSSPVSPEMLYKVEVIIEGGDTSS